MDSEELAHLKAILRSHRRRLWVLEGKEALQGLHTPPDVLIEIEDLREKIARCQSQIDAFPQGYRMSPEGGASQTATSSDAARKQIEITLNGSFDHLTPEIQSALVRTIAAMVDISPDQVAVLRVMAGSVVFVVELPDQAATALLQLYASGDEVIEELGIQNIQLMSGRYLAPSTLAHRPEDLTKDEIGSIQRSAIAGKTLRRGIGGLQVGAAALGAALVSGSVTGVIAFILYPKFDMSEMSRMAYAYEIGLQGGVLGALQGSVTILGILTANRLVGLSSWYTRALGGGILSALIGGLVFLWMGVVMDLFPTEFSLGMLFAYGFVVFGLSSAGASVPIDLSNPNWSIQRASIGVVAAGLLSFIAISSSYLWMDVEEDPSLFWPTVLGYTVVEMAISGGMYLGLNTIASRLRIRELIAKDQNAENDQILQEGGRT